MDEDAVRAAVSRVKPDAVVDLLTALPKNGPRRASELEATNRTRIVASGNLLKAAVEAGVARYVAESFYLIYGTGNLGGRALGEDVAVPIAVRYPKARPVIEALAIKEARAVDAAREGKIQSAVLRFGGFYGFGAGLENLIEALKKRRLPAVRSQNATPWVHVEEAAEAVVAAVERAENGAIYNVAEDESRPISAVLRTLAELSGAPRPLQVPRLVLGLAAPFLKAVLVDTNVRLSNTRARRELGWTPRFRDVESGLRAILGPQSAAASG